LFDSGTEYADQLDNCQLVWDDSVPKSQSFSQTVSKSVGE